MFSVGPVGGFEKTWLIIKDVQNDGALHSYMHIVVFSADYWLQQRHCKMSAQMSIRHYIKLLASCTSVVYTHSCISNKI